MSLSIFIMKYHGSSLTFEPFLSSLKELFSSTYHYISTYIIFYHRFISCLVSQSWSIYNRRFIRVFYLLFESKQRKSSPLPHPFISLGWFPLIRSWILYAINFYNPSFVIIYFTLSSHMIVILHSFYVIDTFSHLSSLSRYRLNC